MLMPEQQFAAWGFENEKHNTGIESPDPSDPDYNRARMYSEYYGGCVNYTFSGCIATQGIDRSPTTLRVKRENSLPSIICYHGTTHV
jgi:hypothetical protein